MELYGKLARLYTPADLGEGNEIEFLPGQTHYLKNVLRKKTDDSVRFFNGREGEWRAEITALGKKHGAAKVAECLRPQPKIKTEIHLLFAPIKKERMNFLIEKAVELGATHLHPVITARTDSRQYNERRIAAQVTEAAEQCERMDIPVLAHPLTLKRAIAGWNFGVDIFWAYERSSARPLSEAAAGKRKNWAFLTGPEGGFEDDEAEFLSDFPFAIPVSLGEAILRAETAALFCLAYAKSRGI